MEESLGIPPTDNGTCNHTTKPETSNDRGESQIRSPCFGIKITSNNESRIQNRESIQTRRNLKQKGRGNHWNT